MAGCCQGSHPRQPHRLNEAWVAHAAPVQVVLLNYRGSTGYGEAALQSLPGAIGTNDVADCLASLQGAVDAGGWVCGVGGGGGFWCAGGCNAAL